MSKTTTLPNQSHAHNFKNRLGCRYGRLIVVEHVGNHVRPNGKKNALWLCRCDCGQQITVVSGNLKSGNTKSCGCYNLETQRSRGTHRASYSSEYKSWCGMKERCGNPNNNRFPDYGGRGITVCEQWENSFETFIADMGMKPSPKHSIDRIDNEKGYFPENCKWSNFIEQTRNTRRNRMLTHNGITRCLTEWSEITGISVGNLWQRKKLGWSDARALTAPLR